jgi:hypothetical protein
MDVIDPDFYTMTVDYSYVSSSGWVADITEAKPGKTDFKLNTFESVVMTNTTAGREMKGQWFLIVPTNLYAPDSGLCAEDTTASSIVGTRNTLLQTSSGSQYCTVTMASQRVLYDPIPADSSVDIGQIGSMKGNRITNYDEAANLLPVLNAPLFSGLVIEVADDGPSWSLVSGVSCDVRVDNFDPSTGSEATFVPVAGDEAVCS